MALRWPNSQMKSQTFLNCYDVQCTTYFSNKTFCDVSRSTLPAFMLRQSVLALLLLFINFCWCGLKLRWFHALNMTLLHVHAWISLESTFLRSTPDFSAHSFLKTYLFRAKWGAEVYLKYANRCTRKSVVSRQAIWKVYFYSPLYMVSILPH